MAVTHSPFPDLPLVQGFRLATAACGLKQSGALDLLLVEMAAETTVAGLFTRNQVVAAPVTLCRQRLAQNQGMARALLVNAGNANAVNGERGMQDALALSQQVASLLQLPEEAVLLASTGVIGVPLPLHKPQQAIPELVENLRASGWQSAAQAIMTTDTFAKGAGRTLTLGGKEVQVVGISKGAGMIHPDMATMLAFLFTDAAVAPELLQRIVQQAVEESFNSISVDGDTSTNDTVLLCASGASGAPLLRDASAPEALRLLAAVTEVCQELAQAIVRDGEGASKFIQIQVEGARNRQEAKQVALSIAKSPLVKTACAGSDPNWGRILAAVGYAGVPLAVERLSLWLGEVAVVADGGRLASYREQQGKEVMQREEIVIRVGLGLGEASHTVWSCDLTHGYITINAEYHT
ncbi:bifunctional glutamate N-acetyltransferase/amino-acid acetyltransferase ArgJ [Candidatus Magnetaquicoccus inordinatus]|uniref:bifunctional glutamate N-acetyltransferase/amino-acid acetyltransferase ArgJ n=1 Tax=Candidatus Magnetaquicoccus inordinatus TaxID=2496818 RepID=UPI00102CF525|nr:bifunctional glutamate N-acetyltransferase/amino-acid acetyltransferase ArgJ [Candidatus Magnetaquicoccus inordinatus]